MDEEKPSPSADLVAGIAWLLLATAIVIGAWQMDRLTHLKVPIYTVPGLVPGLLGLSIGLMALLLVFRAVRAGAVAGMAFPPLRFAAHWRLWTALILCLGFAIGLVGHGLPFWLSASIFVAVFIFIFQYDERKSAGTLSRGALIALVVGLASGLIIHHMFQDLFLVRLP